MRLSDRGSEGAVVVEVAAYVSLSFQAPIMGDNHAP